jgi:flagellar L-ring protein precursor FlgH
MFEDRRARNVGDVLIINIVETTTASGRGAPTTAAASLSTPLSLPDRQARGIPWAAGNTASNPPARATVPQQQFLRRDHRDVTEVLANGNLRVAGEKQVAIKLSEEYVRFSGVVNPATISGSNTVQSTQVADVHVEYKGANNIDTAAVVSMFNRIFFSVLPF